MIGSFRERGRRAAAMGLVAGLALSVVPLLTASPAAADPGTAHTVRATTPHQTSVAPNGPLTGLVDGDTVSIHVEQASASNPIFGVDNVRECQGGSTITNDAELIPSNTGRCLDTPLTAGSNNITGPVGKDPAATGVDITFKVGARATPEAVVYDDGSPGSPHTNNISCNGTSDCRLWITIARSGGNDFVFYDLQFLGNPGAPAVAAACTATGASFTLTPPAVTGHSTVASYTVSATPTDGGTAVAPKTVTAPATTGSFTTFQPFKQYDITATATNAGGLTGPASVAAGSTLGVKTCPAGPTPVNATVAPHQATISWAYPDSANASGYEVVIRDHSAGDTTQTVTVTPGSTLSTVVSGLITGHDYFAKVRATYPGSNFSAYSTEVEFAPPPDAILTQTITVTRPQGALVLTQVCASGSPAPTYTGLTADGKDGAVNGQPDPLYPATDVNGGYPYPQDPATGAVVVNYPTNCGIALGAAKLITTGTGAGQFFQAKGNLNQVTVVDTRDSDPGWTVNGQMADFTNGVPGANNVIKGDELGWIPAAIPTAPFPYSGGTYAQAVTAGPPVAPNQPVGTGLGRIPALTGAGVLAKATANNGLGIAKLDAALTLWIPINKMSGAYTGILSITAV